MNLILQCQAEGFRLICLKIMAPGSEATYSLHCSPFFWFNQVYTKDFIRYPQKGTAMETIGTIPL